LARDMDSPEDDPWRAGHTWDASSAVTMEVLEVQMGGMSVEDVTPVVTTLPPEPDDLWHVPVVVDVVDLEAQMCGMAISEADEADEPIDDAWTAYAPEPEEEEECDLTESDSDDECLTNEVEAQLPKCAMRAWQCKAQDCKNEERGDGVPYCKDHFCYWPGCAAQRIPDRAHCRPHEDRTHPDCELERQGHKCWHCFRNGIFAARDSRDATICGKCETAWIEKCRAEGLMCACCDRPADILGAGKDVDGRLLCTPCHRKWMDCELLDPRDNLPWGISRDWGVFRRALWANAQPQSVQCQ
jgi:hypothetical protein